MFDTMTLTKTLGGLCGALLVFMFAKWGAEALYFTGPEGHGGERVQAYMIETGSSQEAAPAEQGPTFDEVFASADPAAGEKVFRACSACHKVDGTDATGPHLNGVVGRPVDSVAGFGYSGALEKVVDVWTPEHLNEFLTNPAGYAPGTKMTFKGLPKIQDRADVIAYLQSLGG